ncbi:hypothetical protein LB503_006027 [Fusarium chuoi]|nr:hypothetical protein LB503_006027 [Fusarium chuoi]
MKIFRSEHVQGSVPLKGMLIRPFKYFSYHLFFSVASCTALLSATSMSSMVQLRSFSRPLLIHSSQALLVFAISLPSLESLSGGLLLWGVGAAHQIHWSGLLIALGILGAAITAGCQLPLSYCIDCHTELGSDAIATIILIRNTMSFAIGYGVTPWVTRMGYQNAFLVAAFVAMAQFSLAFVFIKYGKQLRRSSTASYFKYLKQVKNDGLIH